MKTIDESSYLLGYQDALDAAIEAIRELNIQNIWNTKFSKPFTREQAVKAIEELKGRRNNAILPSDLRGISRR